MTPATPVLSAWRFDVAAGDRSLVVPDGCRDLIVRAGRHAAASWSVSSLFDRTEPVASACAGTIAGYRFRPAARIDVPRLLRAVSSGDPSDHAAIEAAIASHVRVDPDLEEALACLAHCPDVARAARSAGVSERTLTRRLVGATARPPRYWRALAQVRAAARALHASAELAELASAAGYADQAHMTRAFVRWLGTTPGRVRARRADWPQLDAPGYEAPPIGVHNSTSTPSGSAT